MTVFPVTQDPENIYYVALKNGLKSAERIKVGRLYEAEMRAKEPELPANLLSLINAFEEAAMGLGSEDPIGIEDYMPHRLALMKAIASLV